MSFERSWPVVAPQLFTADGNNLGQIQVSNTKGFKVKANAVVVAVGLPSVSVQIKKVVSSTLLLVGAPNKPITDRTIDLSAYTVAAGAYIYAEEQEKAKVVGQDMLYAVYDQEPTVANRSVMVDQQGRYYEASNPLPVEANIVMPDGLATTSNQTDGSQKTQIVDSSTGTQVLDEAPYSDTGQRALAVRVISQLGAGSGGPSGTIVDKSAFVESITPFTPVGGVFNDSPGSDPTEDQGVAARVTPKRAIHVNIRDNSGTELGTPGNPVRVDPIGSTVQPISVSSLPLPADAASETTVAAINAKINSNFGVYSGALRTAAQIGNSSGSAAFGAGAVSAQTLRVVLPTDQSAIPTSQSGTWSTGRTWNLSFASDKTDISGSSVTFLNSTIAVTQGTSPWVTSRNWELSFVTDSISAVQAGTWNINNIGGTVSLPTGAATESSLAKLTLAQGSTTSGQYGTLAQAAVTTSSPTYVTGQTSPLSLTTAGALRTDSSATTQPVSNAGITSLDAKTTSDFGPLTPSSPTFATVGITSSLAISSNGSRKGLILTNTSSTAIISFGLGTTAVLGSGITLTPYGVWVMDKYTFTTAAINAIASLAGTNLAIQELT